MSLYKLGTRTLGGRFLNLCERVWEASVVVLS